MPGATAADAAFAAEFHDDWGLDLRMRRFELEAVKRASIERAVIRAVVTRSGQTAVQAVYRVLSGGQRLLVKLPREVADGAATLDTNPLRVNGRAVPLERGSDRQSFYIPLAGTPHDQPVTVELRYAVDGSAANIDIPSFPEDPAQQRTFLAVYLPDDLAYLGHRGPWSEELTWRRDKQGRWAPAARFAEQHLFEEVLEVPQAARAAIFDFPTSGRMLLFSAIRPLPPPEGSLQLTTFKHDWLNAVVFGSLAILGVAVVRQRLSRKVIAIGCVAAALLLAGVFFPAASQQIIGQPLVLAIVLVALMWAVVAVVRFDVRSRWAALRQRSPKSPPLASHPHGDTRPPDPAGNADQPDPTAGANQPGDTDPAREGDHE